MKKEIFYNIFTILLISVFIYAGYIDNKITKANFKEEKGSVVVLIKKTKFQRSVTPCRIYLRDSVGNLKDYRITNYEYSFIHLGDTIK